MSKDAKMIVEPGFLDHWKTRMLCDTLADPCAPLYVLRIWEHCQMRRKWVFEVLPSAALKALCRYNGHANQLESALVASGFVRRDEDGTLTALKWDEYNASLVANWDNGAKGGRPPKGGKKTQSKPTENPSETHGLPMANPLETEKRREEKKREEPIPPNPPAGGTGVDFPAGLKTEAFATAWREWEQHRREKRAKLGATTVQRQLSLLASVGHDRAIACIQRSIEQGYTGLFPESLPANATAKVGTSPRVLDQNATDALQWLQGQSHQVREQIVRHYRTTSGGSTASTEDIVKLMPPKLVAIVNEYRQRGAA